MQFASATQQDAARDASLDRAGILQWAEPLIADRLRDIYFDAVSFQHAYHLAAHHRQLWRSALLGGSPAVSTTRQSLRELGKTAGLATDFIEAVDQAILEELLEVVLLRSQVSRHQCRQHSLVLIAVAADLGAARAA